MNTIIKKIIAIAFSVAVCLTTVSTTAFAAGKYLIGLDNDEIFKLLWTELDRGVKGLEASLMYDDCRKFVYSELNMQSKESNYDLDDVYYDFLKFYESKTNGAKINTYSEEVVAYLKEHPDASLRWTGSYSGDYTVYDLNNLVYKGTHKENEPLMQYDPKNIDKLIVWTYDPAIEQFVGKDESGNTVKTIKAYSKPYEYKEPSDNSKQEEPSKSEVSEVEYTSSDQTSEQEEMVVSEPKNSKTNSNINISAVEERAESAAQSLSESSITNDNSSTVDVDIDEDINTSADEVSKKTNPDGNNNSNGITTTIIIICGIVIAGFFAFMIINQEKKKESTTDKIQDNEDKNGEIEKEKIDNEELKKEE